MGEPPSHEVAGQRVGLVLTGSNIDRATLAMVLGKRSKFTIRDAWLTPTKSADQVQVRHVQGRR
jgi:hypothetical protein